MVRPGPKRPGPSVIATGMSTVARERGVVTSAHYEDVEAAPARRQAL